MSSYFNTFLDEKPPLQNINYTDLSRYPEVELFDGEVIEVQPIKWTQARIESVNTNMWRLEVPPSADGFRGCFIEARVS